MKGCGMAVPTKEEFDAWLTLATTPIEVGASLPAEPAELTVDDAAAYLRQADADKERRWRAMLALPAWQWLHSQREFLRAYERVFSTRRRKERDGAEPDIDYFHALAQTYFDNAEESHARRISEGWKDSASEQTRARSLRGLIGRAGSRAFDGDWRTATMRAVAEYLEGKAAASFQNAAAEIGAAAKAAQEAVARFMHLSEVLNEADFLGIWVRGPRFLGGRTEVGVPDIGALPIGSRKDERSNERLFVYRMFVANRRAVRSAKPEAIAELMGMEGFRHQYETRTIERLCKRFAELHKRPSPRLAALGIAE
jgi:hypothetical protein